MFIKIYRLKNKHKKKNGLHEFWFCDYEIKTERLESLSGRIFQLFYLFGRTQGWSITQSHVSQHISFRQLMMCEKFINFTDKINFFAEDKWKMTLQILYRWPGNFDDFFLHLHRIYWIIFWNEEILKFLELSVKEIR